MDGLLCFIFASIIVSGIGSLLIFCMYIEDEYRVSDSDYQIGVVSITINIISVMILLALLKSFYIIPFILYLVVGYICSLKWFPEYVKSKGYNKDYYSFKGYFIIYTYVLFFPWFFIKKVIKTPYTELNKQKEEK